MSEEWRWVDGYEGLYMVSSSGRVKSFRKYKGGYILSNKNSKGDYLRINLFDINRARKTTSIHVLVAKAFIGEIPAGWQVHHIDGNKQNNAVFNLEIVRPQVHRIETERMNPQIKAGLVNYNKYVRPREVLQYTLDGIFIASYKNAKEAGLATGVCHRNILQVAAETPYNERGSARRQAGGYVWKFATKGDVGSDEI